MAGKPFSLTMKAVIVDGEGRTLLIRRSKANKNFVGKWEWPGGKVDPGEDFAVAAIREAKEETGLDVELTGVAGVAQFEMPKAFVSMLCMEARIIGGTLTLSDEHDAYQWVPLSKLPEIELIEGSVRDCMLECARKKMAIAP
jgi:8-oxo-dGTP diphosphatase